jgi:hypothetical protein
MGVEFEILVGAAVAVVVGKANEDRPDGGQLTRREFDERERRILTLSFSICAAEC